MPRPYIRQLQALTIEQAQPPARTMLEDAQRKLGFVPAMYATMANVPAVLSTYLHGYGLFRSESGFTPAEQEVIFLAVSQANGCRYCTAAHSMVADKMSGVPAAVLQAIRDGEVLPDARLATLYAFTTEMLLTHGKPSAAQLQAFYAAGYSEAQVLNIILAISVKTLSNFSNHAFAPTLDAPFAAYALPA